MRMRLQLSLVGLVILVGVVAVASASVPPMISYQGKLMQPNGTPVPDGTYNIRFAIYDAPAGGNTLWSETSPNVQVKSGLIATMLGSVINLPANIFDGQNRFFGIQVGSDAEMTPRQQVASVAFAVKAGTADIAASVPDASITAAKLAPGVAIPPGTVLMWSGAASEVPLGWALCDGENGTPDLRGRFIVGVGTGTYSESPAGTPFSYELLDKGGEASHTLTVDQMPSHNHVMGDGNARSNSPLYVYGNEARAAAFWDGGIAITQPTGGDQPHENRPPYYALCFIMKLGY